MDMINFLHTTVLIVLCHLIGDYVLQVDFIASTKGKNWYHLFVHCALYCVPFLIVFGWTWQLAVIFVTHMIVDPLKARWNKITYTQDQFFHYMIAFLFIQCKAKILIQDWLVSTPAGLFLYFF